MSYFPDTGWLVISRMALCKLQRCNSQFLQVATWPLLACFENQIISQSSSWHYACDEILA
jgi:hypothetical protein